MVKTDSSENKSIAVLIDPQTNESFGKISLVGDPVSASQWIGTSDDLQSFAILGDREELWDVWVQQKEILLRYNHLRERIAALLSHSQRLVKIVTYPAEGETEGYLDFIGEAEELEKEQPKSKFINRPIKRFAFIQSLLGI